MLCAKFGWYWPWRFSNALNVLSLLSPLGKGLAFSLNKFESPSSKDALCQVWLICSAVLEKKVKMWKVYCQTDGQMDDKQLAIRSSLELTFVVGLSLMLKYIPLNKKLISASNKTLSCMQISFYCTQYFWNLKYHNQWKIMHKIKEKYNLKDNGMLLIAQFASEQKCFKKKKLCPSKCGEGGWVVKPTQMLFYIILHEYVIILVPVLWLLVFLKRSINNNIGCQILVSEKKPLEKDEVNQLPVLKFKKVWWNAKCI